jgi:hypothetical protein
MIKTLSLSDFRDEFRGTQYEKQFTYEALETLYNWYNDLDENTECDIVAIACEWTEYESEGEIAEAYENFRTAENNTVILKSDNGHLLVLNY